MGLSFLSLKSSSSLKETHEYVFWQQALYLLLCATFATFMFIRRSHLVHLYRISCKSRQGIISYICLSEFVFLNSVDVWWPYCLQIVNPNSNHDTEQPPTGFKVVLYNQTKVIKNCKWCSHPNCSRWQKLNSVKPAYWKTMSCFLHKYVSTMGESTKAKHGDMVTDGSLAAELHTLHLEFINRKIK